MRGMKKNVYKCILILCVIVSSICGFQIWNMYVEEQIRLADLNKTKKNVIKEEKKGAKFDINWEALQAMNPDIVGWVYVPFCDISRPVVHSQNNDFYLNHNFEGGYDECGTIFLDSADAPDFSSENSILYGHTIADPIYMPTTEGGQMFTGLRNYKVEAFFDAHPYFYLMTPTQNYKIQVAAFLQSTNDILFYNVEFETARQSIVSDMMGRATYYNPNIDTGIGDFITLSTCDLDYGINTNRRLILTGIKTEISGPIEYEG